MRFVCHSIVMLLAVVAASLTLGAAEPPFLRLVQTDGESAGVAEIPPPPPAEVVDESPIVARPLINGPAITLEGPDADFTGDDSEEDDRKPDPGALVFTYIPGSGDDFGMFGFEFRGTPEPHMPEVSMLTAQPGWGITWLNGPLNNDLPPQLYHFAFTLGGQAKVNDDLVVDLAITPGWYTDFENRRPEAFRLLGRAAWYYRLDQQTQVAAGFVYLNRDDIAILPVAGLILDDEGAGHRYELVFPRPKMSWRLSETGTSSRWFTLGGELGGGSWAVKRPDRKPDVLTYRDFRFVGGLEIHGEDGRRAAFEAGWLFGRAIESRTGRDDYNPPDAAMIRMVLDY
jgi:hypothetical protein